VVIASAVEPGTQWLIRRKIPRVVAATLIYLVIGILLAGIFYLLLPAFLTDLAGFINTLPQYVTGSDISSGTGLQVLGGRPAGEMSHTQSFGQTAQNIINTFSAAGGGVLATLTKIFGGATSFVLIVVLSFYLAVQDHGVEQFLKTVTPLRKEEYVIDLWRRTQHKIGRWMQGQILLALIVGILLFIGLTILGVNHAFSLALIAMVFEIIPVFGPIISAVPGVITGFAQSGLTFAFIVALMYLVVQQIESHVIYPLVVKKVINVHPFIVIIALLVGIKLGGFLGALLSVPVATALMEFLNDLSKDRVAARARMNDNV
jgi:predicted PurR-regulated permease PerM